MWRRRAELVIMALAAAAALAAAVDAQEEVVKPDPARAYS